LPEHLLGPKQLAPLQDLLDSLRDHPAHGNRRLFLDQLLVLHLLAFFNPVVRSLRMLDDLSQTPAAAKLLDAERLPKSTIGDAHKLVDPDLLKPVLESLLGALPPGVRLGGELARLQRLILACDASYFQTLSDLSWALQSRKSNQEPGARVALHVQLDVAAGVPRGVELCGSGHSESEVAARHLSPGAIHLFDRGYVSFRLLDALLENGGDFVLRLTTQTRFAASATRLPGGADRQAGVLGDEDGRLQGCTKSDPPDRTLRLVTVANDADPQKPLRLLTSLRDLPAAQVALLYRQRWQVELFFRWLKTYGHFTRLLSHDRAGGAWGFYVSVIGVVLLALYEGRAPSKYDLALLSVVACRGATLQQILPILRRRHRERELARIADARRRTRSK